MDILMPQLGETVTEGTVTNWYKQIGDAVRADEALFDVETDKVATEIPCPVSGVLAEVLVQAGQTVKVGTRLAVVSTASDANASPAAAPEAARASAREAAHTATPSVAEHPERGAQAFAHSRAHEQDAAARADARAVAQSTDARPDRERKLSPVVRRLLAEHGLDATAIRGSGRDGRVTRDDVQAHLARQEALGVMEATANARSAVPQVTSPLPPGEGPGVREAGAKPGERVVALNNIRRRSGAAMARAWQVVPHVLQAVEADYSRIEQARRAKQAAWQAREGFELTYLPFLAFAVCQALTRYDQLNARLDADTLIVSRRVHLGIAVDLNHDGLIVPVIRDAQDRNVAALAREIRRLALSARSSKLKPDELSQPTYTISNSGVFGTLITAPIVNPPQVAILSTDGVSKRPVVVESPEGDSIAARPVGVLAQTFDHRAVDGAYSAAFLKELKRIVETRAWIEDIV
ncbi:MAG: 2-oxo acid dehydrogenase subunit E2 [Burkholderiales bacterium]|nr:2-oxo acid dehydrogenase subunit E2 [Burkholderiales bacterium]